MGGVPWLRMSFPASFWSRKDVTSGPAVSMAQGDSTEYGKSGKPKIHRTNNTTRDQSAGFALGSSLSIFARCPYSQFVSDDAKFDPGL